MIGCGLTLLCLSSCQLTPQQAMRVLSSQDPSAAVESLAKQRLSSYQQNPQLLLNDMRQLQQAMQQLQQVVDGIWGKQQTPVATPKRYVKYTQDYHARAEVDFEQGRLRIETIALKQPRQALKQAIVTTLLTSQNLTAVDIFTDADPNASGPPFLLGQVRDHDGVVVQYRWRAERFAEYLISQQLQQYRQHGKAVYRVDIALVADHQHLREKQYSGAVLTAARRYQIEPALIYAIIETESSFNPYAVSHANAYGLMQVVPSTAGRDVFQRIKKRNDQPTPQQLFEPATNIDIGTAYLHVLDRQYLVSIEHPKSREYAMVSAYNGGAGNVFKTFAGNRAAAVAAINRMMPADVYQRLSANHPLSESRRYLYKVMNNKQRY
ncbi:membrane-bound lytic murein transglycosylase C [Idiomarina xiamenensis 10-D-4]|uniref:Membrane-bound lytic murein transglycosylase C n=2 Tax=Idiomarina xiamenensis TaxID=1207041 RepID=K2JZB0_9GAMM|nr:membrane-bound lytic murein transglycosylase C [Idiomarina xiamenensis 10-D-4]